MDGQDRQCETVTPHPVYPCLIFVYSFLITEGPNYCKRPLKGALFFLSFLSLSMNPDSHKTLSPFLLPMNFHFKTFLNIIILFAAFSNNAWGLTKSAQAIYEKFHPSVYQIQIIDISSGEKSVIGSGFKISQEGHVATNYHVVSDVVENPDRFRIEYHKNREKLGGLTLLTIDVPHDLAILEGDASDQPPLSFRESSLSKGDRVFPMGNPHDLGMMIVEGTYNGYVGGDLYQRILLSAPLNRGMSGGPALDTEGKVIGVNVAMQGNDLSYLVPVKYLRDLIKEISEAPIKREWADIIEDQILKKIEYEISQALQSEWSFENFGSLKIPQKISAASIKCWGESKEEDVEENQFVSYSYKGCQSEYSIYISSRFRTGTIGYSFLKLQSVVLSPMEFAKIYSKKFGAGAFYPSATKKEVTKFACQEDFVTLASHPWKAAYCVRQYKNFPKLRDVFLSLAVLDKPKNGYTIRIGLAGLNENLAYRFLQKFLGGVQWKD